MVTLPLSLAYHSPPLPSRPHPSLPAAEFRGMSLLTASSCADVTQIKKIIAMKPHIIGFLHPLTGNTVLVSAVGCTGCSTRGCRQWRHSMIFSLWLCLSLAVPCQRACHRKTGNAS